MALGGQGAETQGAVRVRSGYLRRTSPRRGPARRLHGGPAWKAVNSTGRSLNGAGARAATGGRVGGADVYDAGGMGGADVYDAGGCAEGHSRSDHARRALERADGASAVVLAAAPRAALRLGRGGWGRDRET